MRRLGFILVLFGPIASASAATFNVVNLNDAGPGSLRQAVLDANASAGADTITFQASLAGTILLTTGQITIAETLTIAGPGQAVLSVSGSNVSRIFNVEAVPSAPETVAIGGLTLTDGLGYVSGDVDASAGGAIRVSGESLTLDGVRVARSYAGGSGGGIAFSGLAGFTTGSQTAATLTIRDSVFFRNFTVEFTTFQMGSGGGIYLRNAALATIENTTLDANGGWLGGGGLWAEAMDATLSLQILGSSFVNNTSGTGGFLSGDFIGAGMGLSGVADATVEDTHVSGNSSMGGGGGIAVTAASHLALRRSTIDNNTSSAAGAAIRVEEASSLELENSTLFHNSNAFSGGITVVESTATINHATIDSNSGEGLSVGLGSSTTLMNSIVAGVGPPAVSNSGTLSIGYSFLDSGSAAVSYTDLGGNIVGSSPQLTSPANNGGPTLTLLPAPASPVVNAGDPAFTPPPSTDQRGVGFPRVIGGRLDMGAVELNAQFADLSVIKTLSGTRVQGSNAIFNITVTNHGPDSADNVVVTDSLPPEVTFLSATPSQGSCIGTTSITCSLGTLDTNATSTIAISVSLTGTGPVTNTASVTTSTIDQDGADDNGSVTFTIAPADLAAIPALDPILLFLLAASLAVAAMLAVRYR